MHCLQKKDVTTKVSFMVIQQQTNIESCWFQLFKSITSWWITFFKSMFIDGLFDISLNLDLQCLRFWVVFFLYLSMSLTRLNLFSHRIRHIRNSNSPGGRPDVLYFTPEGSGVTDCKFHLDSHDVNLAMDYCETPSLFGCSAEFLELSRIIMQEKNLTVPENAADAKTLYITLIQEIEKL